MRSGVAIQLKRHGSVRMDVMKPLVVGLIW